MSAMVPAEWPQAQVLVVDDEPAVLGLLEQVLRRSGYEQVTAVADPVEALARLLTDRTDLLLLDLHLPGMDGTEVLARMAGLPAEQRAPVIVMTGGGTADHALRCLELGAADFLQKPVDTTELLLRVRHQLRERRLRRDLAAHNERLHELVEARAGELTMLSRALDEMPSAAVVVREDLTVRYANARARRWLGLEPPDQLGALTEARDELGRLVGLAAGADEAERRELALPLADGTTRVELQARAVDGAVVVVLHDVEGRERSRDALQRALDVERRANDGLREVERLRTRFLTAVSHELRTPLTSVLGLTESLHRHAARLDEAVRQQLVERTHANAVRLGALLDDLLDLQRLTDDQLALRRELQDLAALVERALAEVDAETHELVLDLRPVRVRADEARLRRAVVNLVRNAVVHTPPGTRVQVTTARCAGHARVRVRDHGPGIAPDLRERIFDRFEQGPTAPSHRPGTGIGLSLVREFVHLHDGRTWVEDTPGGGATFVIELPADADAGVEGA